MRHVYTATGPVAPGEIGLTAMHEHVLWGPPGWEYDSDWWHNVPKVLERCCLDMEDYKALGGKTIVDCSGIGLGRDVELYALISKSTGVYIVCSTAFWAERGILSHFATRDIDYHEELYVRELTQGMGKTNIRAGIIKVGTSTVGPYRDKMTPLEEMTFRAAARAARKTGCAVTTHGVATAMRQLEVFAEEKLDMDRVIIGHCEDASHLDFERDKEIARRGAYVGYDHIGIIKSWSPMFYAMADEDRADLTKAMLDAGYIDRLILSADVNSFSLGWQRSSPIVGKSMVGDLIRFKTKLYRVGITDEQIDHMLIENPRRALPF